MSRILRDHSRLVREATGAVRDERRRRADAQRQTDARAHYNTGRPVSERDRFNLEKRQYADQRSDDFWSKRDQSLNRLYNLTAAQNYANQGKDPGIQREMRSLPGEHPATGKTYAHFSDEASRQARHGTFAPMNQMSERVLHALSGADPMETSKHELEGRKVDQISRQLDQSETKMQADHELEGRKVDQISRQLDQSETKMQAEVLGTLQSMTANDTSGLMKSVLPVIVENSKHVAEPNRYIQETVSLLQGLASGSMPPEGVQIMKDINYNKLKSGEITEEKYREIMDGLDSQGDPDAFAQAVMGLLPKEIQEPIREQYEKKGESSADIGLSRLAEEREEERKEEERKKEAEQKEKPLPDRTAPVENNVQTSGLSHAEPWAGLNDARDWLDRMRGRRDSHYDNLESEIQFMRQNNLTGDQLKQLNLEAQRMAQKQGIPVTEARNLILQERRKRTSSTGLGDL